MCSNIVDIILALALAFTLVCGGLSFLFLTWRT